MEKKKIIKGLVASFLVVGVTSFLAPHVCVSADSGSYGTTKIKELNGSLILRNSGQWSNNGWNGMFWGDYKTNVEGTSSLYWSGITPWNADSIILTNTISVDKIWGSFSAGVEGGTSGLTGQLGMSLSSSDTSQSYTYQITNDYTLYVDYEYNAKVSGFWLAADFYFETSAQTQLGHSFYHQTTGQQHIAK